MRKIGNRTILITVLIAVLIMGQAIISQSRDKTGHVGNKRLCRTMLRHGEDAYKRGDYEKAGYYLLQAVRADSTGMAMKWYGKTEKDESVAPEDESEGIKPEPPVVITPETGGKPRDSEVIIGDDEGC